jgi:glucans biosynthesis protein
MVDGVDRRQVIVGSGAAVAALAAGAARAFASVETGVALAPGKPFSYEWLKDWARALARQPYVPPPRPAPDIVKQIDYAAHGKLRYRP